MFRVDPKARTKLIIEGIAFPVGSDRFIKDRLLHLPNRGKIRRDIDGEARWVANMAGGRIYGLEISTNDIDVPALGDVWGGKVYEITPTQTIKFTIWPGQTSVTANRKPIAAGLDPDGIRLEDQQTGQRITGWTQSGADLETFHLAAARATETIVHMRFTSSWMINDDIVVEGDRLTAKATTRLIFEEVKGTST
jgi:hypothetical protein